MNEFLYLENVMLIIGISPLIKARFVGKSKRNYLFERLRVDGTPFKNGGQLIPIQEFHFSSDKIEGKRVVVMD